MNGVMKKFAQYSACSTHFHPIYKVTRGIVSSKLFVGGLSFNTEEDSLRQAFSAHGDVQDVRIILDRETGRSRGFGFVTFGSEADAEAALQGMDGKVLDGRALRVDYASAAPSPRVGGGFGAGGFGSDGTTFRSTSVGYGSRANNETSNAGFLNDANRFNSDVSPNFVSGGMDGTDPNINEKP